MPPTITILTATGSEAAPIVSALSCPARLPDHDTGIWTGLFNNVQTIVACTGIGMHKTRAVLAEIGELTAGSVVLNAGISGVLAAGIHPGEWREITDVVYTGDDKRYCAASVTGIVPPARLLSVDEPVADRAYAARLCQLYSAEVVDMEGYAVAECCELHQAAWYMLKMISDYADSNAPADYSAQLKVYSDSCVEMLRALVDTLDIC
jgi:nucleoside phosphorylase